LALGLLSSALALPACGAEMPATDTSNASDNSESVASNAEAARRFKNPLVLQDTPERVAKYQTDAKGWLTWAMGLPWSTGPVNDTTGVACDLGQSGDIWYLAGTAGGPVTRDCTIPEDKALFFPLRNLWSIPPAEFVSTPADIADFVGFFTGYFPQDRAETCTLTLRVDGHDLLPSFSALDQNLWVQDLNPFPIFVNPTDNFAGYPGGQMPAALFDGHYALLRPLSKGEHTLEFSATQCDATGTYFDTSVVYHLHVQDDD
jgi:hypothetical protein